MYGYAAVVEFNWDFVAMTVPVVVYRPRGEGPRNNPLGTNFAWRAARDDGPITAKQTDRT